MKNKRLVFVLTAMMALHLVFVAPAYAGSTGRALMSIGKALSKKKALTTLAVFGLGSGSMLAAEKYLSNGEAVYALGFDLKGDEGVTKWADVFSKPDVFPVLMVAGQGQFLIPEMMREYSGGKLLFTFKIPQIARGREVSVFILDDDSDSDKIWRQIASQRVNYDLSAGAKGTIDPLGFKLAAGAGMSVGVECKGNVSGHLQLDMSGITLNNSDMIASYTTQTPNWYLGGEWHTEGDLLDARGRVVGHIVLSQLVNK